MIDIDRTSQQPNSSTVTRLVTAKTSPHPKTLFLGSLNCQVATVQSFFTKQKHLIDCLSNAAWLGFVMQPTHPVLTHLWDCMCNVTDNLQPFLQTVAVSSGFTGRRLQADFRHHVKWLQSQVLQGFSTNIITPYSQVLGQIAPIL